MRTFKGTGSDAPRGHRDAVGAQNSPTGLATLMQCEVCDRTNCIRRPRSGQRRRTRGLQPRVLPGGQLLARGPFKRNQEVLEVGRTELVLGEVAARSLVEGVLTDPGNQLLENGRALGVCDSVEVCLCSCDVRNVCGDRVRGRHLVLRVGPDLTVHREVRPFAHVPRGGGDSAGPLVFRERFLQPQVVPPRGRGEVSEPHVAHLVERCVRAALTLRERGCRTRNVVLVEGDAARVFHRTEVVFGHVDLVVGTPRERDAVARVVEVESGAGHLEDIIGVKVTRKRTTAQESQRQLSMPAIGRASAPGASLDDRPRASNDRRDVAGERAGRREVMAERARLIHGLHACLNPVGGDNPARRCDDVECPFRLHIRLVNARPCAVSIVGLELGVEVNFAVLGIGVAVQAFTAA